jgi:hypothetical protein
MTEQEVKDTVEQIVRLEADEEQLMESDNLIEASAATREVQKLETELEQQGYLLGESGGDMLVYQAGPLRFARDTWLIFDRTEWKWRYSNESN